MTVKTTLLATAAATLVFGAAAWADTHTPIPADAPTTFRGKQWENLTPAERQMLLAKREAWAQKTPAEKRAIKQEVKAKHQARKAERQEKRQERRAAIKAKQAEKKAQ